jgi:dihydroorotase
MISRRRLLSGFSFAPALLAQASMYDLLLKNGQVIDPKNNRSGRLDIGITGGKIVTIAAGIPAARARQLVEVGDYYVTPGLIDLQTHFDFAGADLNLQPDHHSFTNGVTTAVDAGSAGYRNFEAFKARSIDNSRTRILAWLNIAGDGIQGPNVENDNSEMDASACAAVVKKHPATIVGIQTTHSATGNWNAVDRALEAGKLSGSPVVVDFQPKPEHGYPELLGQRMRPGDLLTHSYSLRSAVLDNTKSIPAYTVAARKRGVLFDVGHGSDGFWFRTAVPAIKGGFLPDTISTDIDKTSIMLPRADMTTTMSKLLNIGLSFEQVIERSTVNPAKAIRRVELGQLSEGRVADVAVFEIQNGRFGFVDSGHGRLLGDRKIRCVLTVRSGRVVWDTEGLSTIDWQAAGPYTNYK